MESRGTSRFSSYNPLIRPMRIIDYQILSPRLRGSALRADIFETRRFSDHAPLLMDDDL